MSRKHLKIFFSGLGYLLIVSAPSVFGNMGDVEHGQQVYETYCVTCHGTTGQGDGPLAADLNPRPANLTSTKIRQASDEMIVTSIRKGKSGTAMPAWEGDLSDQDIIHVFRYVRDLGRSGHGKGEHAQ